MSTSNQTLKELFTAVDGLAAEVGKEIKKTNTKIGNTTALKTTNKGDIVSSINELKDALDNTGPSFGLQDAKDGLIKDTVKATDSTYSSQKIETYVTQQVNTAKAAVKADILGGAEAAYDTLKEIQDKVKAGDSTASSLLDGLGKRLRVDEVMVLTEEQQANVAKSLGLTPFDFVETFRTALGAEG